MSGACASASKRGARRGGFDINIVPTDVECDASGVAGSKDGLFEASDDPDAPWGGFKYSGVGREYGAYAAGEVYCMPHHLSVDGKKRSLMVAALRYADTYVKRDDVWLYAERKLYVDWIEERALS